jgi:hypothetical protein
LRNRQDKSGGPMAGRICRLKARRPWRIRDALRPGADWLGTLLGWHGSTR